MRVSSSVIRITVLAAFLLGCAALWRWTNLSAYADVDTLARLAATLRGNPFAPVFILTAYIVSGFIAFPVTVLIVATALVFGPFSSILYALAGCLLNAVVMYGAGQFLGRNMVAQLEEGKFQKVARMLSHQGILSMALIRNIPIAPYSAVNLAAGALQFRFRYYCLGTMLGMVPGIVLISFLTDQLKTLVEEPSLLSGVVSMGLVCLFLLALWAIKYTAGKNPEYRNDVPR